MDLVSRETVVLVAMLRWGAVVITKTLKETGYRVCEGASRTGGFASIDEAQEWFEKGHRRMMAEGWVRLAGKNNGGPPAATVMLQWTRATQIAISRTDAI
ncbi:hypothetical protein [Ancylobacter sp.]|uniref:hypothetical protein n=1 Tax=Ancylobacter sp. TaxID=1872567 RepID=UPI003BABCD5E